LRAIIFDLDGVIVHTDEYHYRAWKQLAERLGLPFDEKKNNRLRGVSRRESLDIVLEGSELAALGEAEKTVLCDEKNASYVAFLQAMGPEALSSEVRDTLNVLRRQGLKLAIGSSSKNAGLILDKIGLGDFFDALCDGNDITHSKPDPEVFLKAATYLGLPAADCVVVEDALAGVEAARRAGMKVFAMGDAGHCGSGDHNMESFAELRDFWSLPFTETKGAL